MILAVLIAPVVAVQVQKWLERFREENERKTRIFKVLMATRATGLSQEHVQALNLIDLEFQGKKYKKVRDCWKEYLDHLGSFPKDDEKAMPVWSDKKADYLATMLMEMGQTLGYEYDSVHIKKGIYLPEGHSQLENEQSLLRRGMIRLLFGDATWKMDVQSFPVDEKGLKDQKDLNEEWLRVLRGSSGVPVVVRNESDNHKKDDV
jgi:hypothetical protein